MNEVKIDKPEQFYDEVRKLIHEHYENRRVLISFAKKYPIIYENYLKVAATRGLTKEHGEE